MKCNDCIYEKMCESRYEREHCLSFKDKANFVEVVRCKDCKHCEQVYLCKFKGGEAELAYTCRVIDKRVSPNHYCGCGERSEKWKILMRNR